jgi:CheY-like chemotaxis protein
MERAFRKIGLTSPIHFVSGGFEAIAYMKGEGKFADRTQYAYPTFIITDLKMPNGDGFDVLHHLKSNPYWAIIPTVVFSGSADLDDVKRSYRMGASSFHRKPVGMEPLQKQMLVLYEYWISCIVPEVDVTGKQRRTESNGKLGERFGQMAD